MVSVTTGVTKSGTYLKSSVFVAESPVRILARELGLRAFDPVAQGLGTYKGSERLDWVLISNELVFVDYTVLPDIVSDHLALLTRIAWEVGK